MGLLSSLTEKLTTRTKTTPATGANSGGTSSSRYRAVQVNAPGEECCQAVLAIQGRRFLSDEVPALPLEGCDAGDCRCTYELFDDRRTEVRRISDDAFDLAGQFHDPDLRAGATRGRRSRDRLKKLA